MQTTNGAPYVFGYAYQPAGLLTETYPSTHVVTTGYDAAGRVQSGTGAATNYATGMTYAPHGALASASLGNLIAETWTYNPRLQPKSTAATLNSASVMNLSYYFCTGATFSCSNNNGNLMQQNIARSGVNVIQMYSYVDPMTGLPLDNRVMAVEECNDTVGCVANPGPAFDWSQTFAYDAVGNRAVTAAGTNGTGTVNPIWTPTLLSQFTLKNQFVRYDPVSMVTADLYDLAGNQTSVASSTSPAVAANTMMYDAENRMVTADFGGTGYVYYAYGPDGRRVTKSTPGTTYVYDAMGQLAAEYTAAAPTYIGTMYLTGDMLGSTRLVTNSLGTAINCYDYMPFGEDIPSGVGPRGSCYPTGVYPATPDVLSDKFTGKERDAESGLDYFGARYLSSAQGWWTSPDAPFADQRPEDPQSWNMYAYVRNNPLTNTDPDGRNCFQGFSSCLSFIGGAIKGAVNAATSGIANLPTTTVNLLIRPFTSYQFQTVFQPPLPANDSDERDGMESFNGAMLAAPTSGEVEYVGRSNNLERRAGEHARDPQKSGLEFNVDKRTDSLDAQKGREQQLYDQHSPPLNKVRPVSATNPNAQKYDDAANQIP